MSDTTNFYRTKLIDLFNELKSTPTFKEMEATVEASPWHREANVLVHTEMVVDEYIRMADEDAGEWSYNDYLGALACVFHDTGKPAAKIQKYREDRGNYFAFHGHEMISSRLFETWAMENLNKIDDDVTASDIFTVCWMIEHHMPWELNDAAKRRNLALTARDAIGVDIYMRALLADQYGRIADDKDAKNARALAWVADFRQLCNEVEESSIDLDTAPVMFVLIGASGSGKSTLTKHLIQEYDDDMEVFSLDRLRHEWYDPSETHEGYANAFTASVEDKQFESKADAVFSKMVKSGKNIVLDNVNASVKRRGKYIRIARQHGYAIVAYTMPISVNTILERQHTRPDKSVPDYAVRQQYNSISQPSFGEVDMIVVSPHNMVTR